MSRPPRRGGGSGDAGSSRSVAVQLGALTERLDGAIRTLETTQIDAREARESVGRLLERHEAQNVAGQLVELRNEIRTEFAAIRQDFVKAHNLLKADLHAERADRKADIEREREDRAKADAALDARVGLLEDERNKVVGVASFFSWLARVAPWLLAGIAAFAAGIGFKQGGS